MSAEPPVMLYIFDADNTLRRTTVPGQPCPHRADEWVLLPQVRERLATIPWSARGPFLGIASNQDHVGYGLLDMATAHELLRAMITAATTPVRPHYFICFCPHRLDVDCTCRKPAPGMLHRLMKHFGIGPMQTLFVGDAPCDREAARRAGVRFIDAVSFFSDDR